MKEIIDFLKWTPARCLLTFLLGLVISVQIHAWYLAGIQQQVYERNGIHMTRWELFCGAKPPIVIKEVSP